LTRNLLFAFADSFDTKKLPNIAEVAKSAFAVAD